MLADTCGDLAKALDLQLDLAAVLGNMRCKRFSMLVEDGTVAKVNIEPDGENHYFSALPLMLEDPTHISQALD